MGGKFVRFRPRQQVRQGGYGSRAGGLLSSAPMNRTLYTLLFHLGLPLVFLRLLWRAWRAPAYSRRIG